MQVSHFSIQLRLKRVFTLVAVTSALASAIAVAESTDFVGPADELQINSEYIARKGVFVQFSATPAKFGPRRYHRR